MVEKFKGYMPKKESERLSTLLHGKLEHTSYNVKDGTDVVIYVNHADMEDCFKRNGWSKTNNPENLPIPKWGDYGVYVQFDRYIKGQPEPIHQEDGSLRTELLGYFAERVGLDLAIIE
jgi:hypothetical protein